MDVLLWDIVKVRQNVKKGSPRKIWNELARKVFLVHREKEITLSVIWESGEEKLVRMMGAGSRGFCFCNMSSIKFHLKIVPPIKVIYLTKLVGKICKIGSLFFLHGLIFVTCIKWIFCLVC